MSLVQVLVPAALCLGMSFLGAFVVSALGGQFDDLDTPAQRILLEDERNDHV